MISIAANPAEEEALEHLGRIRTLRHSVAAIEGLNQIFMLPTLRLLRQQLKGRFFFPLLVMSAAISFATPIESEELPGVAGEYRIQLDTVLKEFDGQTCWVLARAASVPRRDDQSPMILMTMQKLILEGSDVFLAIHDIFSENLGKDWSAPRKNATLARRIEANDVEVGICDLWPKWHRASGRVLGIGQTLRYRGDKLPILQAPSQVAYSSFDPANREWEHWLTLEAPEAMLSYQMSSGGVQRVDLPDGDILLPVRFKENGQEIWKVKVLRCQFDGNRFRCVEEGNTLSHDTKRGLSEPSLTRFRGRYYLTIRHDDTGFVTTSEDGLNFGPLQVWTRDTGEPLGTYNTQTHWVTRADKLYLVYTRRGANNDHVFRHRAPLFIAEVNTETLKIKMATERVLIPERGARYGNFGVCNINANETWITETEWMQRPPEEPIIRPENKWGAAGRVYAARILWDTPNAAWNEN